MPNFGTGIENVTHLKNRTLVYYYAFKCGPASEPLACHEDAFPRPTVGNCSGPNSVMYLFFAQFFI